MQGGNEVARCLLLARSGRGEVAEQYPFNKGGLNRSPQHFILDGKDGVWDGTEIS